MDLYNELSSFREVLKDYKSLLSKLQPHQPLPADYQSHRENILINSSNLVSKIKTLTGEDESLVIYEMGKPRTVDMWQMGLRNEYDYRTVAALDACIDNTTLAVGKIKSDIEKGIRDNQGNVIEKPQRIHITKPQFSNRTLSYIVELLSDRSDTKLRNFFFKHGLLNIYTQSGRLTAKQRKVNDVFQHLCTVGDESAMGTLGLIVREVLKDTQAWLKDGGKSFSEVFPELERGLNADGFQVHEGELIPVISPTVKPAKEEGLVEKFLDKYGFTIAKNHLEQSYDNYLDGNWEAANAALRSFLQDVFDQIALIVAPEEAANKEPGGKRRKLLEEKGFIEADTESKLVSGFFKFAGYKGSHPGISDESDCRLRRYIAVALASYYLEKLGKFHV